jgi:hemerythrin-like domain-containing protein
MSGVSDVFDVLGADHAEVKQMLTALQESPESGQGATNTVLTARRAVAERLVMDSSRHEAAEEQCFWPAVRQRLPGGDKLADEAIGQESEIKELLARLDKLPTADHEFDQLIVPVARQHIEFEETQVWPDLRAALTAGQAHELGEQVRKAEEHGPTRPHPRTPADPAAQRTVGAVAALIDKLRDAVSGRGSE